MNVIKNISAMSHYFVKDYLSKDSICIDCTIGNGNDTLFLCTNAKFVYGFDIQQKALDNTTKLLKENNVTNYRLFLDNHANIQSYVKEKIDVIMFNLGYLPNGNKTITTTSDNSLAAIKSALELLKKDGIMCVTIYDGHDNGKVERKEIVEFAQKLDKRDYHVAYFQLINQPIECPKILLITKNKVD